MSATCFGQNTQQRQHSSSQPGLSELLVSWDGVSHSALSSMECARPSKLKFGHKLLSITLEASYYPVTVYNKNMRAHTSTLGKPSSDYHTHH